MGTISSGVGLVSGLNIEELVTQLIAIEARPLDQLKTRISDAQKQKTAYLELSARLLAAKSAIHSLTSRSAFTQRTATSSNDAVLTATASSAPVGEYAFTVKSLMTTHQLVSPGFADRNQTPVGAGTISFEVGRGRVDPSTSLASLKGGAGVRRGVIRITDRSGGTADIDLRGAATVDDVLEAINSQAGVHVLASVRGGQIVVADQTGQTLGNLIISDVGGGFAARDLGLAGSFAADQVVGGNLVYLTDGTSLSVLNDGTGLRTDGLANDLRFNLRSGESLEVNLSGKLKFTTNLAELNDGRGVRHDAEGKRIIRVTNSKGQSAEVDLSAAQTLQDVVNALQNASLSVSVALSGGKLIVTDTSGGTASNLKIEDVQGYAAADLGIVADTTESGLSGSQIYRMETVGGVLRAITYAQGNNGRLAAAISADGRGLLLTDNSEDQGFLTTVEALNGSLAARDLGLLDAFDGSTLESRDLLAGLNTVLLASLNGGSGVRAGIVQFTRRDGSSFQLDFSQAQTLTDIVGAINQDGRLAAEIGAGGTGITITDSTTGSGTISATGDTADDLHLAAKGQGQLASADLQLQYISENTRLADLNGGKGVDYDAAIRISDSSGKSASFKLLASAHKTICDVIDAINSLPIGVTASINDSGDGIKLVDTAGGTGTLNVLESGTGSAAADLGILKTAQGNVIDGSFASSVQIDADDTLDDLIAKINEADAGVSASVINDGTSMTPYRLVITSQTGGRGGAIAVHTGDAALSFDTLSQARDAAIIVGDPGSANAIVVTSSSNKVSNVVDGLTLNLVSASDNPVNVTVSSDVDSAVSAIKTFVNTYNDVLDRVGAYTKYVPDTGERGVLFGDSTVLQVQNRLYSAMTARVDESGLQYSRFFQVGLTTGYGGQLAFDEGRFREAFAADPEGVNDLFTLLTKDDQGKTVKEGLAARLEDALNQLTNSADGTITLQGNRLDDKVSMFQERAVDMQERLDDKAQRLYNQFYAMEQALASLQSQQSALTSLSSLVTSLTKTSK